MRSPDRSELLALLREATGKDLAPGALEGMTLHELELDSLDLIELSIKLEDAFGLELDVDTLTSGTTVGDLIASMRRA